MNETTTTRYVAFSNPVRFFGPGEQEVAIAREPIILPPDPLDPSGAALTEVQFAEPGHPIELLFSGSLWVDGSPMTHEPVALVARVRYADTFRSISAMYPNVPTGTTGPLQEAEASLNYPSDAPLILMLE